MKIVVTEEIFQKLIDQIISEQEELTEVLGVPENIYETAVYLYDQITRQFPLGDSYYNPQENKYEIRINNYFMIGNYKFSSVKFSIHFRYDFPHNFQKIALLRLYCALESFPVSTKAEHIKSSELNINIEFAIKNDVKKEVAFSYIEQNDKEIVKSLAHELKHTYDHYVKPSTNLNKIANYQAYSTPLHELPPIQEFLHYVYYTQDIEGSVRPTEFYATMKQANVDQKGFADFLKNNPMYRMLKDISSWSITTMIRRLRYYISDITRILREKNNPAANGTDDQKIYEILKLTYYDLINTKDMNLFAQLVHNPAEPLKPEWKTSEKAKILQQHRKEISKFYKRPILFYKYEEAKMKKEADKIIRKLGKLYGLAKETPLK